MAGIGVGFIIGLLGFVFLEKSVYAITSLKKLPLWLFALHPFLLMPAITIGAFLLPSQIHWIGAGTAFVLILGAFSSPFRYKRRMNRE